MNRNMKGKVSATILIALVVIAVIVVGAVWYFYPTLVPPPATTPPPTTAPPTTAPPTTAPPTTAPPTTAPPTTAPPTTAPPEPAVTLNYLCEAGPEPELIPDTFEWYVEEHPGTKITFAPDVSPRDIARLKLLSEITERRNNYQLFWTWLGDTQMMIAHDMLVPMEDVLPAELIAKVKANLPSFVLEAVQKDGKTYTLPIYWNSLNMFYRTDLFNDPTEKANFEARYGYELKPPETYKEWIDVAEFFTRPPDLYGYAINGAGWAFWWDEYGASGLPCAGIYPFVDIEAETTTVNSPQGVKLMETLVKLVEFTPPGWETSDWFTTGDVLFAQGKLAMWNNWYYPWPMFQNPEKSQVVGKVGISRTPTIDETVPTKTQLSGGGVGISQLATEDQKRAAVKYIEWMLSDPVQKRMALTGELFMYSRLDILQDPEVSAKLLPEPFIELSQQQTFFLLPVDVNELIGLWVNESAEAHQRVVRGEMTAQQACDWLAEHILKIVRESKG